MHTEGFSSVKEVMGSKVIITLFFFFLISFGFPNSLHSQILKDHKTLFMILPSQETKYVHFYSM